MAHQPYVSVPSEDQRDPNDLGNSTLTDRYSHETPEDNEFELASLDSLDYDLANGAEDQQADNESGKSNLPAAFMNMANSILGAGIIGQPFAFRNAGFAGGIFALILLTFLIDWTLRLIVKNAQKSNTRSYQDTAYHCFGKWGRVVLLLSIGSFAYGGCMAFCVIIGDTIPHVLKAFIPRSVVESPAVGWLFHRNVIITLFTTCISYPLSLNKDISKLAKASGFALGGMSIIVLIVAIRAPFVERDLKGGMSVLQWTVNYNIFQGISVISFALVCHHNTLFIYNSLKLSVKRNFDKLTHVVCLFSMVFCFAMAACGLLNFGDKTKGNVLNNFKGNDNWINVARFCFGLNMLTTFPLEIFVVRDVVKEIVLSITEDTSGGTTSHLELNSRQHFFITTIAVFSSMVVSLFTCNLGIILELIGATSASLMAYIIPPLCFLKLSWDEVDLKTVTPAEKKKFYLAKALPALACTLFGFSLMFISSFMSIRTSMRETGESHCAVD